MLCDATIVAARAGLRVDLAGLAGRNGQPLEEASRLGRPIDRFDAAKGRQGGVKARARPAANVTRYLK